MSESSLSDVLSVVLTRWRFSGSGSLASQLAAIRDVAPAEYDPEAAAFEGSGSSAKRNGSDLDAGRSDYLAVGESQLRKNLDTELGGRYAGVKSSRSELYHQVNGEDASEGVSDDEEDVPSDNDEELEDGSISDESVSNDDEESMPSDDAPDAQEDVVASAKQSRKPARAVAVDEDSRQMIQELKKASSVEVDKGRAVRKQLVSGSIPSDANSRL